MGIGSLGGLTGGMSIHRKDQRHKLKIVPFELHRRIQAFGTLGTHYATVVGRGGPAVEYGSHGQCQVTAGDEGLPPWVDGKTKISPDVGDVKSRYERLRSWTEDGQKTRDMTRSRAYSSTQQGPSRRRSAIFQCLLLNIQCPYLLSSLPRYCSSLCT